MTVIPSPYMAGPRLADARPRAAAAPAASAEPLHPVWEKAIAAAEPPAARDRVADAPDQPPAFSFRTPDDLLRRLPAPAAALLRRLDDAATEARDRTVALGRHIDAAHDRLAVRRADLHGAIRAARQHRLETVDDARRVLATPPTSREWGEAERRHAEVIVAAADRAAEVEAEIARLRARLAEHNLAAAPIAALRQRLAEAAGRLRPPIRALDLPAIDAKKPDRALADARAAIATIRAGIEAIETALPPPADAEALAAEAVRRYGAEAGLSAAAKWTGRDIVIAEAVPGLASDDRRPLRPLALLCAVMPDLVADVIVRAIGTDADAPPVADRPRLIADLRQRLREAELRERAAIAALGDPLEVFRPDADPAITLMVEAGR
ncbi:hypothetical protein [Elioraea tepidiphila]|uniref:hypothetical protein n=1 Tax=Elioraea tepidiphila TaxID=457934 RepID=UPI00037DA121|nr:hypothetical protein [Elioraea tepidiphila]